MAKALAHTFHKQSYFLFVVLIFLIHNARLWAQESAAGNATSTDNDKLHVLIVDGKVEREIGAVDRTVTSSTYSVIETERLRNSQVTLPEILQQEVGVQVRTTGGVGSLSTVVLRGASNEQVVIYLDGVPINDASGGSVDLSFIPLDIIERIEVYRGSTPIELGSPSIGGAVNIVTRKTVTDDSVGGSGSDSTNINQDRNAGQLSIGVASFNTYKLSGTSSHSGKKDDVLLSASYLQSKNDFSYSNDNGTQFNPADDRVEKRNNDGVKQLAVLANWKHRINRDYDTELRLDVLDQEKEIPSATNNADVQTQLDTLQYGFLGQLNVHDIGSGKVDLNVKLFASRKKEVFDDTLAQIGFFNQHTESITRKQGAQIYTSFDQRQMQWKLLTGISRETYQSESKQSLVESGLNARDKLELSVENVSFFLQHQLIMNVVLRYQKLFDEVADVTDGFGRVTPGFDKTYELVNPQLGLKYRFNRRTYTTANIGIYDRAPSFLELFGGNGLLLGNPDLKQETSLNSDLGLTYAWFRPGSWLHDTELYAGVFYNKVENLIVRIFNGQGLGVPRNISDAVIRGFESTLKITPGKHHSINVNLTLIDSINKSEITSFEGKTLPGYYQQSYGLRYTYSLNRWSYSAEADIKRNMFYDRSNLLKGDDVNLLNLAARKYFKDSNIDFRIDNILDENIQYFRNRPTPGLSLSLTYNHSF